MGHSSSLANSPSTPARLGSQVSLSVSPASMDNPLVNPDKTVSSLPASILDSPWEHQAGRNARPSRTSS